MYHGIINVYKEPGYTSHDVVARLRGILKQKKIGHTGTLDPAAEGVLPVCLGMGTRLCDMLADRTKTYEAVLLLGCSTDTQDTTGTILTENREKALALDPETAEKVILGFKGDYDQIPPMYSALKVDGKKLCDLARAGKEVERKARRVQILEISILNMELPRVSIRVTCSKGTYIRTLCDDIGRELGTGGCMEHLLRTRVDRFLVEDSLKLDEIEQLRDMDGLEEKIYIGRELGTGGCMEHLLRTRVDRFLVEDSLKLDEIEQLRDMDGLEEKIYTVEEALEGENLHGGGGVGGLSGGLHSAGRR